MPRRKSPEAPNDQEFFDDLAGYKPADSSAPFEPELHEIPLPSGVATGADGNRSAPLFSKDRTFDPHAHDWMQRGRELRCTTCPENHAHGTIIPVGYQLIGARGHWRLVPEGGRKREATSP